VTESRFAEKRKVKKRLLYISAVANTVRKLPSTVTAVLKDIAPMSASFSSLPRWSSLDGCCQNRVADHATIFFVASLALGLVGFLVGYRFLPRSLRL